MRPPEQVHSAEYTVVNNRQQAPSGKSWLTQQIRLQNRQPVERYKGGNAMPYRWTKTEEDPAVYHDNEDCSEGKKIEPLNRDEGSSPPPGRRLCDVCAGLH